MTENRDVGIELSGLSTAREGLTKRPSIIARDGTQQVTASQQHLCISIILFNREENNGLHVIENPAAAKPLFMYSLLCTAGVCLGNHRLLLRDQISAKV